MTIDGVFDHTSGIPDEEIHEHYSTLLIDADEILYGRKTYELMQYWQTILKHPTIETAEKNFALAIDHIQKTVFSHSLKKTDWDTATLCSKPLEEYVRELKTQPGKNILAGSRSIIMQLMKMKLIDEVQLCVYPVIAGNGAILFNDELDRTLFKLVKTKIFKGGAILLFYEPKYT